MDLYRPQQYTKILNRETSFTDFHYLLLIIYSIFSSYNLTSNYYEEFYYSFQVFYIKNRFFLFSIFSQPYFVLKNHK